MTPYCHRAYRSQGIARHRRAHLDRGQECLITLADGTWLYRPDTADDEDDSAEPGSRPRTIETIEQSEKESQP